MEKRKINNIDCYFHYDNRFKTICLKLHFLSPYINKDNAAKTLLLRLLFKTNKKYHREDILNYKLEELYESSLMYLFAFLFLQEVFGKIVTLLSILHFLFFFFQILP